MGTQIIKTFNGRTIRVREDRYMSLTDMAQATGKRVNDWLRLESSKSYIALLSSSTSIPADQLVEVNESSGSNEERGTWAYCKLGLRFAQWCSDEFAIQVDTWVDELLSKGEVSIKNRTAAESALAQVQQLVVMAQQLVDTEREQLRLKEEQDRLADEQQVLVEGFEEHSRQLIEVHAELDRMHNSSDGHYMTIMGFANTRGIRIDGRTANTLGRKAAKYSRLNNLVIEKVKDTTFGYINAYHPQALAHAFDN